MVTTIERPIAANPRTRTRKHIVPGALNTRAQQDVTTMRPDDAAIRVYSHSQLQTYQNCPRSYEWKYLEGLKTESTNAMNAGSVIHATLEAWYSEYTQPGTRSINTLFAAIRRKMQEQGVPLVIDPQTGVVLNYDTLTREDQVSYMQYMATARAYIDRYKSIDCAWEVIATECDIYAPIVNPNTGGRVHNARILGRIDMVIRDRETDEYWIVEHKTKASIDGDYLASLAMQRQPQIYAMLAGYLLNVPISGVIYNVICRPGISPKAGETDDEYQIRLAELTAASKTGKPSTAKQRIAETPESYLTRLAEWFADPDKIRLHREAIYYNETDLRNQQRELFELVQMVGMNRSRGLWPKNTSQCYPFAGSNCPYVGLCAASNPLLLVDDWKERMAGGDSVGRGGHCFTVPTPSQVMSDGWDSLL